MIRLQRNFSYAASAYALQEAKRSFYSAQFKEAEKLQKTLDKVRNLYVKPGTPGEKAASKARIEELEKKLRDLGVEPLHRKSQEQTDSEWNGFNWDEFKQKSTTGSSSSEDFERAFFTKTHQIAALYLISLLALPILAGKAFIAKSSPKECLIDVKNHFKASLSVAAFQASAAPLIAAGAIGGAVAGLMTADLLNTSTALLRRAFTATPPSPSSLLLKSFHALGALGLLSGAGYGSCMYVFPIGNQTLDQVEKDFSKSHRDLHTGALIISTLYGAMHRFHTSSIGPMVALTGACVFPAALLSCYQDHTKKQDLR